MNGDLVTKVVRTTLIATLTHHGIEAAGGEPGILLQGLHDVREVVVEHGWTTEAVYLR
jgi:hypothetical protein